MLVAVAGGSEAPFTGAVHVELVGLEVLPELVKRFQYRCGDFAELAELVFQLVELVQIVVDDTQRACCFLLLGQGVRAIGVAYGLVQCLHPGFDLV